MTTTEYDENTERTNTARRNGRIRSAVVPFTVRFRCCWLIVVTLITLLIAGMLWLGRTPTILILIDHSMINSRDWPYQPARGPPLSCLPACPSPHLTPPPHPSSSYTASLPPMMRGRCDSTAVHHPPACCPPRCCCSNTPLLMIITPSSYYYSKSPSAGAAMDPPRLPSSSSSSSRHSQTVTPPPTAHTRQPLAYCL